MAESTDSRDRLLQALQDPNNDVVAIYGYYYDSIIRHTGISIKFTNCRRCIVTSQFIIDVSTDVNGPLKRMQCATWNCEAKIVVNEIDPDEPRYEVTKSPIAIFPLCQEGTRSDAKRYVERLLVPTSKTFQLFFNNCRDHTNRAIRGLCCDGQCRPKGREEALRNTQARRIGDSLRLFTGVFGYCVAAGVGSLIVYYIFGR